MIKPTIGRVVWYYPLGDTSDEQPLAALIAHVWSDTCVNLAVFDSNGIASNQTSVFLYQNEPNTEKPSSSFCEWMPYQQGQAAKTEAVEKQLSAIKPQDTVLA